MAGDYTPQQIEEILQMFFDVAGTRQYIGARYVPLFGRKGETSIAWDDTKPYEPLTIVLYQGSSYTSRQYVPAGIDISDEDYWAKTGDYNSQVESYRQEVLNLSDQVSGFDTRIDAVEDSLPIAEFSGSNTVKDYIDDTVESVAKNVNFMKRPIGDFFGVVVHSLNAADVAAYKSIGAKRLRMDITWANVETVAGVYNFATYDSVVSLAEENDMKLLFILDYNNTLYADATSDPITTDANRDAFVNFVSAAVNRYKNKHIDWEIWNEPNYRYTANDYYLLVQSVSGVIRTLDPTGNVVVGAIGHDGELAETWWTECCSLGILDYADKFSVHTYSKPYPEGQLYSVLSTYGAINQQYSNANKYVPIVVSEIGYNTHSSTPNAPTDTDRGAYECRQILLCLNYDVDSVYIYEAKSAYTGNNSEAYFGLFNNSLEPTQTAIKIGNLFNTINSCKFVQYMVCRDYDYCMELEDENGTSLYLTWTGNSNSNVNVTQEKPYGAYASFSRLFNTARYFLKAGVRNVGTHAETFNDSNTASGVRSHAEGKGTTASGESSHSEGDGTTASGGQAHAEGFHTTASGGYSHAEGNGTTASSGGSHAEGVNTVAGNQQAHAEGYATKATGQWSHAGGNSSEAQQGNTFAHGDHALARNTGAIALGNHVQTYRDDQTVVGKYNEDDSNMAFIVGWGSSGNRKNIFCVDGNGCLQLRSPNNTKYWLYVDDTGNLVVTSTRPS